MTEAEQLLKIKEMTNYTDDFHDSYLQGWIEAAKSDLSDMGISDEYLDSNASVGVIAKYILIENGDIVLNGSDSERWDRQLSRLAFTYPKEV